MVVKLEPLNPEAAIMAFKKRGHNLNPSFAWQDTWQDIHATSFTVAKSAGYDILDIIYDALLKALTNGTNYQTFLEELKPLLIEKGWWGTVNTIDPLTGEPLLAQLGSTRRLRQIFDVNMRVSYASGQWAGFEERKADRPFLRYVGIIDDVIRPSHEKLHNLVLPVDDPFWNIFAAPNGWNCRCTMQSLSQRDIDRLLQHGERLKFIAPEITWRDYVNPRTGETSKVPKGVDVGWGYNAGKFGFAAIQDRLAVRQRAIAEKLEN